MSPSRRRSLAGRLLLVYAVAVLAVLGVAAFLIERAARDALLDLVEARLVEQARSVAPATPADPAEVAGYVARLAPELDVRMTVIAADGTVVADSHGDAETMENHASRPEVVAAKSEGVGVHRRVSVSTGFDQLYVAVPAPHGQVMRLSLEQSIVDAPVMGFTARLILIVSLVGLLGVAVAAAAARRLSGPLVRLGEVASQVAAGNLEVELPRSRVAELDELGRSIETMAGEIDRRLTQVGDERRTLEVVLDSVPQGTLLVDADGSVLYANRAWQGLLGSVPAHLDQVVPFRIQEMLRLSWAEGETGDADLEHGRPVRVLRVITSALSDGRGLVVVSDATDRRRVDEVRRDFVTNASHELKTPVSSILASAESLQMALERAPDRVPEFAARIEGSARSLARLVSDLLDLSRLEGKVVEHEPVRLDRTVAAEVGRIRSLAEEQGIEVASDVAAVTVEGSEADLGLAIRNLLDNAVRYSEAGGRVTVEVRVEGSEAVVTVSDTGAGIPQRDLERIFERFYRVDVARSRATGGTGLGLSIVRHVVESHGGRVTVVSQLGEGSTFVVRLPLGDGPD